MLGKWRRHVINVKSVVNNVEHFQRIVRLAEVSITWPMASAAIQNVFCGKWKWNFVYLFNSLKKSETIEWSFNFAARSEKRCITLTTEWHLIFSTGKLLGRDIWNPIFNMMNSNFNTISHTLITFENIFIKISHIIGEKLHLSRMFWQEMNNILLHMSCNDMFFFKYIAEKLVWKSSFGLSNAVFEGIRTKPPRHKLPDKNPKPNPPGQKTPEQNFVIDKTFLPWISLLLFSSLI